MLASSLPTKFSIPFANSAVAPYIRAIPTASQIGITGGAASLTDGFPPITFVPVGAGGIPPWGEDFNGLLNQISAWVRFGNCAGGLTQFDSAFSTAISGYPYGAILAASNGVTAGSPQGGGHAWFSMVDNNTVNPDTTFNTANWIPVPAVINPSVTYTVGGTGAQFSDLITAMSYLGNFYINGAVVLQYAAGVFNYSSQVVIAHPQNNKISLLGATMLGALGTTDASYAHNGSSPAQRATDAVTNIATLRTKFATELHFTGGAGLQVSGLMLKQIDALLFTGDGTVAGGGDGEGCDFGCRGATTSPTSGLACYNFGGWGFTFVTGSSIIWQGTAPFVSIGNVIDGMIVNGSSFVQFAGPIILMQNTSSGLEIDMAAINTIGNIYTECNGNVGITIGQGRYFGVNGNIYTNANGGLSAQIGTSVSISNMDFGSGGNINGTRPILANDGTIVNVGSSTNTAGSSPAVGVVGNNNSLITTT